MQPSGILISLAGELRRIEAEVIIDGHLLTDHFPIDPTTWSRENYYEYN